MSERDLVVVSNRLPLVLDNDGEGQWKFRPGTGGLVTALSPVLHDRGGKWIGWLGATHKNLPPGPELEVLLNEGAETIGYALQPVDLTEDEVQKHYFGFSNEILWPLFHDLPTRCNFDPSYWPVYEAVNRKFAESVLDNTVEEDFIWVHDYQLILVASEIRRMGGRRKMGFFLHIPFPPLDVFIRLPWRFQILDAFLRYDLIGFQTERDRRNFISCVRALNRSVKVAGHGHACSLLTPERKLRVGSFPISIDFCAFADLSAQRRVGNQAQLIRANLPNRKLLFGVDRLDYTKGIPNRLHAFADALERYPELKRRITLIQVVVPSRRSIREYELLKKEIDRLVGEINGKYTQVGWTPIIHIFGSLSRPDLVSYYQACEIAIITPLKDGMNLVAKEYCASNVRENGVLILSEFAGAAANLHQGALLVNPYDTHGVADAIYQAFMMNAEDRRERMKRLRRTIRRNDIYRWVAAFLKAGMAEDLKDFPLMEFFVPKRRDVFSPNVRRPSPGLARGRATIMRRDSAERHVSTNDSA